MNTITSDPGLLGEPSEPRPSYSTYFLLHNILRPLAADDCEIIINAENAGPAVTAVRDLPHAFGIEPDMGEPWPGLCHKPGRWAAISGARSSVLAG
jgi:hypothetical protein